MKFQYVNILSTLILFISLSLPACVPPPVTTAPTEPVIIDSTPVPTNAPVATDTSIPTFTPTQTPFRRPIEEIFPQATEGKDWLFPDDQPSLIKAGIIEGELCSHSGPYGVQITYNFTTFGGGWGIHWGESPLKYFDATGFTNLTFWVKGASGKENFQIGLKDTGLIDVDDDQNEVKVDSNDYQLVSKSEWREVVVPLDKFTGNQGPVNIASIDNVTFTFEAKHGSGSICIDDIAFK